MTDQLPKKPFDLEAAKRGEPMIERRARSTGTIVAIDDQGAKCPDGRWMTVCVTHAGCVHHATKKLAIQWLSHPEDWCPDCQTSSHEITE